MKPLLSIIIVVLFFFLTAPVNGVNAQVFKLELANPGQTIKTGDTFDVNIMINTAGEETINGDALINYESSKVTINSATNGGFFTYFAATPLGGTANKYLITAWELVGYSKSTTEEKLFATFTAKALSGPSTTFSFDCTPDTGADSNINRASDSEDIIDCNGLNTLTVSIGGDSIVPTATGTPVPSPTGASQPTATPLPTATSVPPTSTPIPTNTPQPQVTELPKAGIFESTIAFLSVGVVLTMFGLLAML